MRTLGVIAFALALPSVAASDPAELVLHTRSGIGVSTSEKIFGVRDDPVDFTAPGLMESSQLGLRLLGGFSFFLELTTITRAPSLRTVPTGLPLLEGSTPFGVILGAGVGRFLWDTGPYISVAAGLSADEMVVLDGALTQTSPWGSGFGFSARVDRTWRAGEHLYFTVAGQFLYMANPDRQDAGLVESTWGLGALIAVSYDYS
jgi:hypothetical protein